MKFSQIPVATFEQIQLNAGIIVDDFDPATGVIGNIVGATSGGVNFTDTPTYKDFGEDIDNCPKNMKELKQLDSREVKMAGTFVTVTADTAKTLAGSADIDSDDETHIIPRNNILQTDFTTLWWIGDYSDVNTGDNAGFIALKLLNALNTAGFAIQSTDKEKGKFAFEFTGHYSMNAQDTVPYEMYVKQGGEQPAPLPSVLLSDHAIELVEDATKTLTVTTVPADASVTYSSGDNLIATVTSGGVVTGEGAGNTIITASITVDGVIYTDTCTVIVTAAPEP